MLLELYVGYSQVRKKYCRCLPWLLAFCVYLIGMSVQANQQSALSDTALPPPEEPQPSVSQTLPKHQRHSIPLVSARYLERLSSEIITKNYPHGVKVLMLNATMSLKKKLKKLESKDFKVIWLVQDNKEMEALAMKVVSQKNYTSLLRFLSRAYGASGAGAQMQVSVCPVFLKKEFIPYVIRETRPIHELSLQTLGDYSSDFYQRFLVNHYFWNDLGYPGMVEVPERIQDWIIQSVPAIKKINQLALGTCRANLPLDKFSFVSQLIALDYLSNAVRGLYYQNHQGQLHRYRKLAVETLQLPSE